MYNITNKLIFVNSYVFNSICKSRMNYVFKNNKKTKIRIYFNKVYNIKNYYIKIYNKKNTNQFFLLYIFNTFITTKGKQSYIFYTYLSKKVFFNLDLAMKI